MPSFVSLVLLGLGIACSLMACGGAGAEAGRPSTDWFREARYGAFMHFLPGDAAGLAQVKDFDVNALAQQLQEIGARYFVFTLGQNSGYFNAPNRVYDEITGYRPGERCSTRDLPLDLYKALKPKGIRLMLYLPCQTPNQDPKAQAAFGLSQSPWDRPIDLTFAAKWSRVIQEWSDRYGAKVAGWWFDGAYDGIHFNEAIAQVYSKAAKHGNPRALVTFNPGVMLVRHTRAEDYTAGELNEPLSHVPESRFLDGSQWHALTYVGSSWAQRDTRFTGQQWADWARAVTSRGGVVTLDMGPNYDPKAGPIGSLAPAQVAEARAVKAALGGQSSPKASAKTPKRLPRSRSFLGIHYDFHAGPDCTEIGKNTTREMIESIIDQVHPDYIQTDCKGHPGLSSYPTKVGNQAPGFVGDPLRLWREVTAEHGVSLYMHYSGVWDSEAIRKHPDWAVVNADGSRNGNATSFYSPYADELLVPQLRELSGVYGVDGAWVDGECWASQPDYGEAALKAFREATGIQEVPRKPGDPHWTEFLDFNRDDFRSYLRHYIAEVRRTNPKMQLCSNWAFTDHMPEKVCAPVDWISGDLSPQDAVNAARASARYIAGQGKPWDLMAWSFTTEPGKGGGNRKTAVQLQREAAEVISQGGGFQAYFTQRRDGSVKLDEVPVMAEVARFCRARQAACQGAKSVPQVALLYSTAEHYREMNSLFPRDLTKLQGPLQALLRSQLSVDLLSEHNLRGHLAKYPLVVVPECDYLEPAFRKALLAYVRRGGNLLLVGPRTAGLFQAELGYTPQGDLQSQPVTLSEGGAKTLMPGVFQAVRLPAGAAPVGALQAGDSSTPAASVQELGKGKVAATYFSFSQGYLSGRPEGARAFLEGLARQLFPKPMVEVTGSHDVDVMVSRVRGKLTVSLVNTAGPHATEPILDAIPPVGPLRVVLREQPKPSRVRLEPEGRSLPFEYQDGEIRVALPSLEIHSILVVD
ncbi:MAG TPA: alpha-L-fucosidase [Armatimonadota bacterium]|jgi:hypothetical protein